METILSITGSDNTGLAGIQADIKTITSLGGNALTAVTSVTIQDSHGIQSVYDLSKDIIVGQVRSIISEQHPKAVKVGLLRNKETIMAIRDEIIACNKIVLVPGIISSHGTRLVDDETMEAIKCYLIPEATILLIRCSEAEFLLGTRIATDEDMLSVAQTLVNMGSEAVLLRGGTHTKDSVKSLLYQTDGSHSFFSSVNVEGWLKHGISGALSSAITTRLAFGDSIPDAISHAHEYMHSQVVYSVSPVLRPMDIYNKFLSLLAAHYHDVHDVASYANMLSITTRYLSTITQKLVNKTPKQVIGEYIVKEAQNLLANSMFNIQEISIKLGFSSQELFSKYFKKYSGMSPRQYRFHRK